VEVGEINELQIEKRKNWRSKTKKVPNQEQSRPATRGRSGVACKSWRPQETGKLSPESRMIKILDVDRVKAKLKKASHPALCIRRKEGVVSQRYGNIKTDTA